ncbi:helix-turn-helix transcriptional regulator [Gordonia sputi]
MTSPNSKFAASDRREIHKRELGAFLAHKRASTRPEDVGIPVAAGTKRRTPGLRREEVAFAAGVGVSWYTWIEQGRAENVSGEILDSLARVLRLTTNERLYIRRLAGRDCTVADPDTAIPDALLQPYPDNWRSGPAYVVDYRWNIRAANTSATKILGFASGVNVLEAVFTSTVTHAGFTDPAQAQRDHVARFRTHLSNYQCDPDLCQLTRSLNARSAAFRRLWQEHNIAEDSCGDTSLVMPHGDVLMHWTTLSFTERIGMKFVAYYPLEE